jgi:uncharacterized protein (TIGR03435 family)
MTRILGETGVLLSASAGMSLIVKATVAVTLGLLGASLARKGRAAVRHAFLAAAFVVLLALPILAVIATPVTIAVPAASSAGGVSPLLDFNHPSSAGETASARPGTDPGQSAWSLTSLAATPISTILFYGWLIGIALFVIPVIRGLRQIRSLRRFGLPWRHGQEVAERLAPHARRAVEVLLHESLSAPLTCSVLRPVVVFPADAQTWDEKDVERALVHELEHVRRYDWTMHCLARVACAAYWFHPLVWVARRQLMLEAERSCDDAVLGKSEPIAYANQLLGLARRRSAVSRSPALAMANRSDLAARIKALLDPTQSRGPVGAWALAACVIAAAIVLTMSPLRLVAATQSSAAVVAQDVPNWDAVSVKRCVDPPVNLVDKRNARINQSPDRLTINCLPVSTLINLAYTLNASGRTTPPPYPVPIERLPSWADSERYTIEAKSRENAAPAIMRGPMLKALLEDRFALKLHHETREGRVYLATAAKSGLKLQPFAGGCTPVEFLHPPSTAPQNPCLESRHATGPNITIDIPGMDLESFLWFLGAFNGSARFDGPLVNKTGVTGYFHFHLEFLDPSDPEADEARFPSIVTAMEQQLGLKLEAGKGPHDYLVVDRLERPTPN